MMFDVIRLMPAGENDRTQRQVGRRKREEKLRAESTRASFADEPPRLGKSHSAQPYRLWHGGSHLHLQTLEAPIFAGEY